MLTRLRFTARRRSAARSIRRGAAPQKNPADAAQSALRRDARTEGAFFLAFSVSVPCAGAVSAMDLDGAWGLATMATTRCGSEKEKAAAFLGEEEAENRGGERTRRMQRSRREASPSLSWSLN